MRHTAIYLFTVPLLLFAATDARGQAGPPLGDDFIFFVNGTNTLVPSFDGNIIDDPADPTNSDRRICVWKLGLPSLSIPRRCWR